MAPKDNIVINDKNVGLLSREAKRLLKKQEEHGRLYPGPSAKKALTSAKEQGLYLTESDSLPEPEVVLRIIDVAKKIIRGESRLNIEEWLTKQGISDAKIKQYYKAAERFLVPDADSEFRNNLAAKNLARYEQLYSDAYKRKQYKVAKDILDSINKMYGITSGNKVEIAENAAGEKIINIQFD